MASAAAKPKVDTAGTLKHEAVATGTASRMAGDWLAVERKAGAAILQDAMARLCPSEKPDHVSPASSARVAKPGASSPLGLREDFFDPAASYEDNLEKLKKKGVDRFPTLSRAERWHETSFALRVQLRPKQYVAGAEALAARTEVPTYSVDSQKRQYAPYGKRKRPADDAQRAIRLKMNHALHPTAVAIARLAFLKKLDELATLPKDDPKRQIFVTGGGCSVGKGSLNETLQRLQGGLQLGAIWDAAGEGEARENAWLLEACKSRGLKVLFGYAVADPLTRYGDALDRSERIGRVSDVLTFARSYVEGDKNMRAFLASEEFKSAAKKGIATALVIDTGPRDPNVAKKTFSNAKVLASGEVAPRKIPRPPSLGDIVGSAIGRLEERLAVRRQKHLPTQDLLTGALGVLQKFDLKELAR